MVSHPCYLGKFGRGESVSSSISSYCTEDDQQQEQTSSIRYESCKRTQEEDEFLLMQFQIVWLVLGGWAVLQVRKQKQSSASLFDQRKQRGGSAAASNDKLRSSERDLELTERQKREERMPLTSYMVTTESSLEVV